MYLSYIDENLNKIMQNSDNVMYLRPYDIGNKRALFAVVKEEEGVYKKVQITKEQSVATFPLEPLYWFYNGPGYYYLNNFITFYNRIALNANKLDGFKDKKLNSKIFNVGIFATFDDGSSTFVTSEREKKFKKQGGIKPYTDLIKKYKEYNPEHDDYEVIELHKSNEDTFIIPELQKKSEEQPLVKKL